LASNPFIWSKTTVGYLYSSAQLKVCEDFNSGGVTLPKELWYGLLLFIPASFVGAKIAKKIVDKIPQDKFRIVVAAFLLIVGIKLLLFS